MPSRTLHARVSGIAFLSTIAAITAGLSGVAVASTSLTVKVTNGGTYTAAASGATLTDTRNNVKWTCTTDSKPASRMAGTLNNGTHTGASPVKIGVVSGLAFHNCVGPFGTVTMKARALPYGVKVDSTTDSKGDTDMIVSGIDIAVSFFGCSFILSGSAPGYYVNGTHKLHMTSALPITPLNKARLTINDVNGCAGVWRDGDHMTISAVYSFGIPVNIKST